MRTFLNILTLIAMVLTVLLIGQLVYGLATNGFTNGTGMAILFFQLWGAIFAAASLILGFIGRIWDRRVPLPAGRISNSGIAVGLLGGLVLLSMGFWG